MFSSSIHASTDMNNTLTLENLRITGENLDQAFQRVDTCVQFAFSQKNVLDSTQESMKTNTTAKDTVHHALVTAVASEDSITQMVLCSDEDGLVSTYAVRIPPFSDMNTCVEHFSQQSAANVKNTRSWYFLQTDPMRTSQNAFAQVRKIRPTTNSAKELMLVVYVSEDYIEDSYKFLGQDSYIVNKDGFIISAVNKEMIGTKVSFDVDDLERKTKPQFLKQEKSVFSYSVYLPTIAAYLIVNTEATALAATKHAMLVISLAVLLIGLAFSLIWAKYIANTMTRPLKELKSAMEAVRNGSLATHCSIQQEDEIGYLGEVFNHMIDSLNENIDRINQQNDMIKENEIRLLQSQINPHLLYNTIDSAVCLVERNERTQSKLVLETLSDYFKMALQSGNKVIKVKSAVQHIESYLQLQKLCRMKNYTFTVTGDEKLQQAEILHMLLQPIVENSVLHGFEGHFAKGNIELNLSQNAGDLIITVTDNGTGMDEEELAALRAKLSSPTSGRSGFALWNVVQRIKMYYGSQYGIEIFSEWGEYTTVRMTIPCRMSTQEGEKYV